MIRTSRRDWFGVPFDPFQLPIAARLTRNKDLFYAGCTGFGVFLEEAHQIMADFGNGLISQNVMLPIDLVRET
jgi:hypothetical protein